MKKILENISHLFSVSDPVFKRDNLLFVTVEKEKAIDLITHLKNKEGFVHFVILSGVDWIEEGKFQLTYILNNPDKKVDLAVKTMISRENPIMESAHHLWESIFVYQREIREMLGIEFPNSPGLYENFVLEGWQDIPPMRRDFDTKKYAEETFFPREGRSTNDPTEYMKKKLYPDFPEEGEKNGKK